MSDEEYDPAQGYPPVQNQDSFSPSRPLNQPFQPNEYAKPISQPVPQYPGGPSTQPPSQKPQHFLKPTAPKQPTHVYAEKDTDDLDDIPPYLRERIQAIIDRKVAEKIDEEMAQFKEEIRERLDDMQQQNQAQMGQYAQPVPVVYAPPQAVPYGGYPPQYAQYPPAQPNYYGGPP